ncbi:hypothetical protein NIES3974_14010 [Calothrix sp. NIES-3974]|nr:hypothetical protein NIES3974_14010 [Calothrix sp. NIES-3974]
MGNFVADWTTIPHYHNISNSAIAYMEDGYLSHAGWANKAAITRTPRN